MLRPALVLLPLLALLTTPAQAAFNCQTGGWIHWYEYGLDESYIVTFFNRPGQTGREQYLKYKGAMEKMAAYVARAPNQQRIANLHSFQNVVKTLADCGYGDGAAAAVHATPPQRYAPEPTEQQKSAQREAVADKASRSVLSQFGDDKASNKGKANAPAGSADNAAPQKHYGSAVGCIRLVRQGAGDFQNVLGNSCAYPIIVSFCTMSGRGTGAFNCAKRSYGSDSIAPGGSQAIMGAGVPDAGDPFELLFAACRAPASPNVSGQVGPHLLFTCR